MMRAKLGFVLAGLCVLAVVGLAPLASAQGPDAPREIFVSPQGRPEAAGTKDDPLDLATVLQGNAARPGDIVWLLPGTYHAPTRDGKRAPFLSKLQGTAKAPIVVRAARGGRVIIDGSLEIRGGYTWYWGFEVTDLTFTERTTEGAQGHETLINVFGPGTKFINLDVHDGVQGFGFWSLAKNAEIYGCLIHDFGYQGKDRGHGHAIYAQNETGTKSIVDNIMFRGYGWNIHVYGQRGGLSGFHIEGNICFASGTRVKGQVTDNILVAGFRPADRITLINNYCYQSGGIKEKGAGWRPCVRLDSYKRDVINGSCVVCDNVICGARGLQLGKWKSAAVSGNVVWGPEVVASVYPPNGRFENYRWDGNTYIFTGQKAPFVVAGVGGRFEVWKRRTGFDENSKTITVKGDRPSGTFVNIRVNKYEPGRAHIAVWNWEHKKSVEVDLSGIVEVGARFAVYNVQDLYGDPVVSGVYDGKPVELPMLMSPIAPDFDAFLVKQVE